jgi:uncharacterized lipoprotein YddW (UPF0748 family)
MRRARRLLSLCFLMVLSTVAAAVLAQEGQSQRIYLPVVRMPAPVQITACAVNDVDGNLATTHDRSPLTGWTMTLIVNGQPTEPGKATDASGCVTWSKLSALYHYAVSEEVPDGWMALNGPTRVVGQLAPGDTYTFTFYNTEPMVEVRALWVTRFDWTTPSGASPSKIDEIVANAALAGFNTIYFQVRGEGDAYYRSYHEPWAQRVSGTFGQDPGWDPLAYMISRAHARGIQVHAYINTYPIWLGCTPPPEWVTPRHAYYRLVDAHGVSSGRPRGLQWNSSGQVICSDYMRASPASIFGDDLLLAVAKDIVTRYDVDGLHLDHIRYAWGASCDPVSLCRYTYDSDSCSPVPACPLGSDGYKAWQRAQVNGTVRKFYQQIVPLKPGLWLSAAVWHTYIDYWHWGFSEGYHDYYQDSKAWLQEGIIDSISPMIYSWNPDTFPTWRWQTLVSDFQNSRAGRFIVPGIGGTAFDSFGEIEARINLARQIGTAGHAIFSYGQLYERQYFDDLRAGPYARPSVVPAIPWHP